MIWRLVTVLFALTLVGLVNGWLNQSDHIYIRALWMGFTTGTLIASLASDWVFRKGR